MVVIAYLCASLAFCPSEILRYCVEKAKSIIEILYDLAARRPAFLRKEHVLVIRRYHW